MLCQALWELIYNEVDDDVEEVGISVLTAYGVDVVANDSTLAGTSEHHFEVDIKWTNEEKHVLDEVSNKVEVLERKVEEKMDDVKNEILQEMDIMMETLVQKPG